MLLLPYIFWKLMLLSYSKIIRGHTKTKAKTMTKTKTQTKTEKRKLLKLNLLRLDNWMAINLNWKPFCNFPDMQFCMYQISSQVIMHIHIVIFLLASQNFDHYSILQFPEVNQTPLYWCLVRHLYVCLHFLMQEDEKDRMSKFHLLPHISLFFTLFITLFITLHITPCHFHWQEENIIFLVLSEDPDKCLEVFFTSSFCHI